MLLLQRSRKSADKSRVPCRKNRQHTSWSTGVGHNTDCEHAQRSIQEGGISADRLECRIFRQEMISEQVWELQRHYTAIDTRRRNQQSASEPVKDSIATQHRDQQVRCRKDRCYTHQITPQVIFEQSIYWKPLLCINYEKAFNGMDRRKTLRNRIQHYRVAGKTVNIIWFTTLQIHVWRTAYRCSPSEFWCQTRLLALSLSHSSDGRMDYKDFHIWMEARSTLYRLDATRRFELRRWPRFSIPYTAKNADKDK